MSTLFHLTAVHWFMNFHLLRHHPSTECSSNKSSDHSSGFSLTRKCASETHCLAEKWKRDAKQRGERVLSDAHGLRMVVYYWSLNLNLKRSAKNSFENKIRIWNLCSVLVHLSTPKPATITPLN